MALADMRCALLLLGLALVAPEAFGQEDAKDKPARSGEEREQTRTADQPAAKPDAKPNERPRELLDPREFPEGVTVLVPREQSGPEAERYPEGVTVLGPWRPNVDGPRIRVRVEAGAPTPELPELEDLPPPEDPATGTSLGPTGTQEGGTIGPNVGEQQKAFLEPPRTGGNLLPPYVGWTPESAYPDADIANPYPWNPSSWIEPVFDNAWKPTSTWPEGQDRRDWSPVRWITPGIDYRWQPEDAWGRSLGIPAPSENRIAGPPDAAEPEDAASPEDAQQAEDAGPGGEE